MSPDGHSQTASAPRPTPGPSPSPSPPHRASSRDRPEPPSPSRSAGEYDPDRATPPANSLRTRDLVRLFQCQVCSYPLREPVRLPCGNSMCRGCFPELRRRTNITYPGIPDRVHGFRCPFAGCSREHALEDCSVDVILNKVTELVRDELDRAKLEAVDAGVTTRILKQDPWAAAGITSMRDQEESVAIKGGRLVATYTLAEEGDLKYDQDVSFDDLIRSDPDSTEVQTDEALLRRAQGAARAEMDCQVCYAIFYDPLTTSCGHTFCRGCLHRILDHAHYCPICRRQLVINPLLNRHACPSNTTLTKILEAFWLDELQARKQVLAADRASQLEDFDFPLFICTLAFPSMPTFLHVFEPRYRLLIRRALEGDRTFGMVLPRRSTGSGDPDFHEFGTLLRIVNVQYFPDGRSLIETVGLSRFRVIRHGYLDGYIVGKVERLDDVSLEEEEAMEAAEARSSEDPLPTPSPDEETVSKADMEPSDEQPQPQSAHIPTSLDDIRCMSTQHLFQFASAFVARMRSRSVSWLPDRMLSLYGECPSDAAVFPWWFASLLPVKDIEKYKLLGTSSVRERLKICCSWIIEWEATRWRNQSLPTQQD